MKLNFLIILFSLAVNAQENKVLKFRFQKKAPAVDSLITPSEAISVAKIENEKPLELKSKKVWEVSLGTSFSSFPYSLAGHFSRQVTEGIAVGVELTPANLGSSKVGLGRHWDWAMFAQWKVLQKNFWQNKFELNVQGGLLQTSFKEITETREGERVTTRTDFVFTQSPFIGLYGKYFVNDWAFVGLERKVFLKSFPVDESFFSNFGFLAGGVF